MGKNKTKTPAKSSDAPTALTLSEGLREISISEFFTKNRHLLGFDNPTKALLTSVREAVDNALDACEEADVLPDIDVKIRPSKGEDRYIVSVTDNGPGIVSEQIPKIFGKLLYGSRFHVLKMTRGQQGIGISAAGMYGQLTTGQPIRVRSRISRKHPANYYEIQIDTTRNEPEIVKSHEVEWEVSRGTQVEIELVGKHQRGRRSIEEYLKQTAIVNPHACLRHEAPDGTKMTFERASHDLPDQPREVKPHPHGIELGMLIRMLKDTKAKTLKSFLTTDFSRVSPRMAQAICQNAKLYERARPTRIAKREADSLYKAINETKLMKPPTDCLIPIGEEQILLGLKKEIEADFYVAVTRPPTVYRGNPFQVEVGLAYGGDLVADEPIRLMRFANRVPLLYQQSACAVTRAVGATAWRNYKLSQPKGSLPIGPVILTVHLASVWVPFTSESKEAIAHYESILKEIKLGVQECGRKMASFINKRRRAVEAEKKRTYIEKYIPHIAGSLAGILGLPDKKRDVMLEELREILERSRS